jgi:hypothetical protein
MFLRKIFQEFLVLQTDAEPVVRADAPPTRPLSGTAADERPLPAPGIGSFDWRWLETDEDAP